MIGTTEWSGDVVADIRRRDVREAEVEAAAAALEAAVVVMRALNDPTEARSVAALCALMEAWSRRAAERRARAVLGDGASNEAVAAEAQAWREGLDDRTLSDASRPGMDRRLAGSLRGLSTQGRVVRARALVLALLGTLTDDLRKSGQDVAGGAVAMLADDLGPQMDMIAADLSAADRRMRAVDVDWTPTDADAEPFPAKTV